MCYSLEILVAPRGVLSGMWSSLRRASPCAPSCTRLATCLQVPLSFACVGALVAGASFLSPPPQKSGPLLRCVSFHWTSGLRRGGRAGLHERLLLALPDSCVGLFATLLRVSILCSERAGGQRGARRGRCAREDARRQHCTRRSHHVEHDAPRAASISPSLFLLLFPLLLFLFFLFFFGCGSRSC